MWRRPLDPMRQMNSAHRSVRKPKLLQADAYLQAIRASVFRYPKGLPDYRTGHSENPQMCFRIIGNHHSVWPKLANQE